jgi:hypothetical protein
VQLGGSRVVLSDSYLRFYELLPFLVRIPLQGPTLAKKFVKGNTRLLTAKCQVKTGIFGEYHVT